MANILVINTGSTSIKFKLFDLEQNELADGEVSHIDNFEEAIKKLLRQITNLGEIKAAVHRVVHGGGKYFNPVLLTTEIINDLESYNYLAPLHNPHNLAGIKALAGFLPQVRQVAVFDTGFYQDLPSVARTYGLPKKIYEQHKIYRYGFHGISHQYAKEEAAKKLGIRNDKINLISCHIGGGCSVTAIKSGKPIDISTGFTPTEGLLMMTRTGDMDPSIVIELLRILPGEINSAKVDRVYDLINKESGIKGISGVDDYLELIKLVSLGQPDAVLAFDLFIYRLVKYIGAYFTALGGKVDTLVFTGEIGAGQKITRESILKKIKFLNLAPLIVETNEELMMVRAAHNLIK